MKTIKFPGACLVTTLLLFCGSAFADPLNNWHWRNPLPNGNPQPAPPTIYGIVFANGTFFAVGGAGMIYTSIDSTNWTPSQSATSNQLSDIIYAGGQFVAVGNSGTVETSANGTNWVLQNSGTSGSLGSVVYGKGKYLTGGSSTIIISSDAVHWSPAVSGGLSGLGGVAGGSVGFVAMGGSTNVYFSSDGLNWTTNTLPVPTGGYFPQDYPGPFVAQIMTYAHGKFLVGGYYYASSGSVNAFIFSSTDGVNWTTSSLGTFYTGFIFGFNYSFFITTSNAVLAYGQGEDNDFQESSTDGVNWTYTGFYDSGPNYLPLYWDPSQYAGAYGNGSYAVVNSGPPGFYNSPDGLNWTNISLLPPAPVGPTSTFNSIAYSNGMYVVATSSSFVDSTNGLVYVTESGTPSLTSVIAYTYDGVGFFGSVGNSGQVYTSSDGLTWTKHTSATTSNLHCITAGNNLLVAVGDNGTVVTSTSGGIWTSRSSGTSLPLYGVTYSNGLFVAVGQQGTVVTSPDSINWTAQDSGVLNNLASVTYGSAGFLAVGNNGTIVTSPDGVNWTQQNPGNTNTIESASFGEGYYLVVGANATVLTSSNGVNWVSRNVGATGGQMFNESAFLNDRFDIVGSGGTIIESDPVTQLGVQIQGKVPQQVITVFATPGISFRIQDSINPGSSSSWSTVDTVNNAAAVTYWTNSAAGGNQCYYRVVSP